MEKHSQNKLFLKSTGSSRIYTAPPSKREKHLEKLEVKSSIEYIDLLMYIAPPFARNEIPIKWLHDIKFLILRNSIHEYFCLFILSLLL